METWRQSEILRRTLLDWLAEDLETPHPASPQGGEGQEQDTSQSGEGQEKRPSLHGRRGEPGDRDRQIKQLEWREWLLRDLRWLLQSSSLDQTVDLDDFPLVQRSVLNYGWPNPAGRHLKDKDEVLRLERRLVEAIRDFEPRLLRYAPEVHVVSEPGHSPVNILKLSIEANLPAGLQALRAIVEIDLETGEVTLRPAARG